MRSRDDLPLALLLLLPALLPGAGCSHGGWRLPTVKEMFTLVDPRRQSPAVDLAAFPDASTSNLWTSTMFDLGTASYWTARFIDGGYIWPHQVGSSNPGRCVRNAP
jgi:hypothetical protein